MENSDDFEKVLNLVRGLPDDAVGFIGKLPELLKTIGSGLAEAGEQAAKAAGALVGDDGEGGARKALTGSANTMHAAKEKLTGAAGMLSGLAGEPRLTSCFTVGVLCSRPAVIQVASHLKPHAAGPVRSSAAS
jgi:hypothetical protein